MVRDTGGRVQIVRAGDGTAGPPIRECEIARDPAGRVATITDRQFDPPGSLVRTRVKVLARGPDNRVSGEARLHVNDRLVAIHSGRGQLVQAVRTPPGLFATEVQPQSLGLGLSRNLLLVTFEERELAARGAA